MYFFSLEELWQQNGFPFVAENLYRKERYIIFEQDKEGFFVARLLKKDQFVPRFGESDALLRPDSHSWILTSVERACYKKEDNVLFVNF